MNSSKRIVSALAVLASGTVLAFGQGWNGECLDPNNMMPYSPGYGIFFLEDGLISASIGVSGNVTYGGPQGPCYGPTARTLDAAGRLAFSVGAEGSIQSTFDDQMAMTTGSPIDPVGDFTYAKILKDGETNGDSVLYGNQGLRVAFVGASKRYSITAWTDADVDVECKAQVLGDAVRLRWRLRNQKNVPQRLGLLFASYAGMIRQGMADSTGSTQANSWLPTFEFGTIKDLNIPVDHYLGTIMLPTGRPVRNERRYDSNNIKFPANCKVLFGQTEAYGVRFDNLPGPETPDATSADLFLIGNYGDFTTPGLIHNNNIRLRVFTDTDNNPNPLEEADIFLRETAIVQRFPTANVLPGEFRDVVHYIRQPWGVSDYEDPYTVTVDAPQLIATSATGVNGLSPNPFTIRAYVDDQYATLDKEVDLHSVRFTIFLPPGLALANGDAQQKTIDLIKANELGHIDWRVISNGKTFGDLPYKITVSPTPGPTKTLNGIIRVSATPRLELPAGPNMVTIPYTFPDTSLEDILKLQAGVDYIAYRWDPDQGAYVPAISVERGRGYWILPTSDLGFKVLQGAKQPADTNSGGLLISLHQGWNLIGNPYSYSVPLNQLLVVAEDSPKDSYTWIEAVANNFVQSSMIQWQRDDNQPNGGNYVYTQGSSDVMEPHKGYWIYVSTFKPCRLSWPAVFLPTLPNSGRAVDNSWTQNDRQWRLQLSARSTSGIDSQNWVAIVSDKKKASQYVLRKPPAAPGQPVELYIEDQIDGKTVHMTQAVTERAVRKDWDVSVKTRVAGDVTVTWPNLPSVPRNMRFRVTDLASGEAHDLRSVSGYTFHMATAGVRKLKLSMEPGGSTRPVIGNVIVSGQGRGNRGPLSVSYALSADALVTVRILSGQGKEIFTVTRGRADGAGQNKVTWAMRDNANRAVAAGTYNVEILAETPNGERVRRIVPVTVIR